VYPHNAEPNPLIEVTKGDQIVSICAAESSSSEYPFLGDHVVRHWRDSTGDLFGEVRRLRHLRGSEGPPLGSTFCRAGLRIIMGIGRGGSVLKSNTCGLFVMSKRFKEANIYVNSEFDLRRVLPPGCFYF
jgi:hypothetical protein